MNDLTLSLYIGIVVGSFVAITFQIMKIKNPAIYYAIGFLSALVPCIIYIGF